MSSVGGRADDLLEYSNPLHHSVQLQVGGRPVVILVDAGVASVEELCTSVVFSVAATCKGCRVQSLATYNCITVTVCPRIHHPATRLPKPYLIATNPLKALEFWEAWKAKPDLPGISQPG